MSTNAIALVLPVSKIDVNRISFIQSQSKPGRIPGINIKYDGQNLQLRLPRLSFPFGASSGMNNDGPANNLSAPLKGCDPLGVERADESSDIGRFYNFLIDLQEKILTTAIANNNKWFPALPNGKKPSETNIRDNMKPLFRLHSVVKPATGDRVPSGKYAPTISFKIPIYDNRVSMDIIDNKGHPVYVTPNTLDKVFHAHAEANLVASPSIYIMTGGAFGVTWRVNYAQVFPQARVTAASVFADDIEDEDEEEAVAVSTPPGRALTSEETAVDVEIPDLPEDAPAPVSVPDTPAPSGRKRRVAVA